MFWKNNAPPSQIDSLLAKADVTLQEVMESDDIISECRAQNKNLIDFLLKPEIMSELVLLTTTEPSDEKEMKERFKYSHIASELLSCDVPSINERLAGDERLLEKLYEFLEKEPPLNSLLASYFSKIMGGLIAKKTEQVLDFLKAKETFLPLLMKHLETSAIMDLMLKLMTQVEGVEMRQNILNWLDSQRVIQKLISLFDPKVDKDRHDNVAQLLCDFLRTARDTQRGCTERLFPDPLLNTLESPETIKGLLNEMLFKEKCESSIVGGISLLLVLLDVNQTSSTGFRSAARMLGNNMYSVNINYEAADMEHKQKIIKNTTEAIAGVVKEFHMLLLEPPKKNPVLTTVGTLDPPLGNTRLQIIKLLSSIVSTNYGNLHEQLIDLGTFPVLLDLFFKYSFNNFLHTQVENCIVAVLETGTAQEGEEISNLCKHLLDNCNLVERVIGSWKTNDQNQSEHKAIRQGYMGHLITMVTYILEITTETPLGEWFKKVKPETANMLDEFKVATLQEVLEQQDTILGGQLPSAAIQDNEEYGDIPFVENSDLQQQSYSEYQMQNLSTQYIDGYSGFNDDSFNDGDDTLQTIDNPSDINFDLRESDLMQRDALFKQVCAQSINTLFDAEDQIFEERDHTFQTVIEKKESQDAHAEVNSSDSDDESPSTSGGEDNMDIDPWTSAKNDPWSTLATTTSCGDENSTGWADFSAASFSSDAQAAFEANFPDSPEKKDEETAQEEQSATAADPKPTINKSSETIGSISVKQGAEGSKEEKEETRQETAAAGDHPLQGDEEASKNSGLPPSMALAGDLTPPKAPPPLATTVQPEKV
ncbi:serine/threonine-protein phosphatase 6 regulatory subunit 3 isoform X2 [Anthonomus grandis grandis]|uniref:serine/threonine-protein phosphatase 6 regulatory subunit 3 isoform X2 n=1 Tax=Anthonomus grandis grandis TaxID=2921223 RepID=UPI002165491F|nr:serine/threonine-protein phosphatase 6 regulatory subunit 3 isoform X2 [Anthonomus grandis grandis]